MNNPVYRAANYITYSGTYDYGYLIYHYSVFIPHRYSLPLPNN